MLAFLFLWRGHIAVQCCMFTKKGADASGRMNAIYMAINGIIDTWRVSLRSQIYSPEGNLGCHGLFALTRNRVKGIWDWVAGCAQGKRS